MLGLLGLCRVCAISVQHEEPTMYYCTTGVNDNATISEHASSATLSIGHQHFISGTLLSSFTRAGFPFLDLYLPLVFDIFKMEV